MIKLIAIYVSLLLLLGLTLLAHEFPLGALGTPVALAIALAKTILVGWFFMSLNVSAKLSRLAAGAGLLWLFFFLFLGGLDVFFRPLP